MQQSAHRHWPRERRGDWRDALYDALLENEVAYRLTAELLQPRPLSTRWFTFSMACLSAPVNRRKKCWRTSHLVRRPASRVEPSCGQSSFLHSRRWRAVVTFPGRIVPKLAVGRDTTAQQPAAEIPGACSTCGQHYFEHHAAGWEFTAKAPGGGETVEDRCVWRPQDASTGNQAARRHGYGDLR